jgi:hypothetical protein
MTKESSGTPGCCITGIVIDCGYSTVTDVPLLQYRLLRDGLLSGYCRFEASVSFRPIHCCGCKWGARRNRRRCGNRLMGFILTSFGSLGDIGMVP